ncbi:MAG: sigma-54-dependent Fis family transcriptional regulator [Deltaproteobacteria bacterium]|nr:sigma-54-dependent Fis family transcriptional regulator [Deltaproteobacteria bacterium]
MKSRLTGEEFDAVILQVQAQEDLAELSAIGSFNPYAPVIILGEATESTLIVKAIKEGAFDYLTQPFTADTISFALSKALENRNLKDEIDYLRREQDIIYDFEKIIAESPSMKQTISSLKKFAHTDSTILMTGETGTGKSFLAGAIHFNSSRKGHPYIKINCTNIPENLLESELFGHEKGSFTGANKTRIGRLEQAKNGTVFLDEVGEMPLLLQSKLLRFLEEKSFERVGGNKTIHSDVRVIAATNRILEEQVKEGKFREDLYYRINVLRVHLPPLRDRKECIEPLCNYLMNKIGRNLKKTVKGFSREALSVLQSYSWPGNIRQVSNTIERAIILEDTGVIGIKDIILPELGIVSPAEENNIRHVTLSSIVDNEKDLILQALEKSLWIQKDAAKMLGISPRVLNYKIKVLGITHARWRKHKTT